MQPLRPVLERLNDYDIVSYSSSRKNDVVCEGNEFSSNWLAGRKKNRFHEVWWENMKHKMTRMCGEGDFKLEKVCCHEAFAPTPEKRSCHVPWAQLEWLKYPPSDADARGPPKKDPTQQHGDQGGGSAADGRHDAQEVMAAVERGNAKARQLPPDAKLYCLNGDRQLAPHHNGEIFWQPWDVKGQRTDRSSKGPHFDMRFECAERDGGDLVCQRGNWGGNAQTFTKMFNRTAYHLFSSARGPSFWGRLLKSVRTRKQVLNGPWLISEYYRRSLGLPRPSLPLPKLQVD